MVKFCVLDSVTQRRGSSVKHILITAGGPGAVIRGDKETA